MLTDTYHRIPLELIDVKRDERQRREINVDDLLGSIRIRGVLQPIIVEESEETSGRYVLIAGERRYTASCQLKIPTIPARLASSLDQRERRIIELEENLKRKDLTWKEEAKAVSDIHDLYMGLDPDWTQAKTAESLGMVQGNVSLYLSVSEELAKGNKNVEAAQGLRAAYNILSRRQERAIDDAMNELLLEDDTTPVVHVDGIEHAVEPSAKIISLVPVFPESIHNSNFHEFAASYSGVPFNFVHCDFPYGINHQDSDQGKSEQWGGYDDTESTYWDLCTTLCANINRIMAPLSHLMFWLSSDIERQYETIKFFRQNSDLEVQTVPLTWIKTDNRGILPDPKRGPRRITETALIASRGDRLIIRAISNAYGAPSSKEIHQSEKPEPVLRHFFQMFVDEHTRILDPTCGSGTSLRAAESLGASFATGLEINPDFCEAAKIALKKSRVLRTHQEKRA